MPGGRPLTAPADVVFRYDGGLKGFYCCVYDSVYSGRLPAAIHPAGEGQLSLLSEHVVITDASRALRVRDAVRSRISPRAVELVETVFLSCMAEKELPMLRFLLLGFERGSSITNHVQHPDVAALLKAERHLTGEAHLLKGFVRFSDYGGRLMALIRPKNFILPFLAQHFCERLSEEAFMVYDRTNAAALIHEHGHAQIVPMEAPPALQADGTELLYRTLWKQFYKTIAIKARENPRCRMTHMPKRYWAEMTEMHELL